MWSSQKGSAWSQKDGVQLGDGVTDTLDPYTPPPALSMPNGTMRRNVNPIAEAMAARRAQHRWGQLNLTPEPSWNQWLPGGQMTVPNAPVVEAPATGPSIPTMPVTRPSLPDVLARKRQLTQMPNQYITLPR